MFAGLEQTLVEALYIGVVTRRDHGAQAQRGARVRTAAPDSTFATKGAAIAIERRNPGKSADLSTREGAELGEIADQGAGDGSTDTGHRRE